MHRYNLAAELSRAKRVRTIDSAHSAGRRLLEDAAATLDGPGDDADVLLALDGLEDASLREQALAEAERFVAAGRAALLVLAAVERDGGSPRAGSTDASAVVARLPGSVVLRQFLAEGSLIVGDGSGELEASLQSTDAAPDDAAAVIVATGFEDLELAGARADMRLAVAPVMRSYVRFLEGANAELLRANRELARERIGSAGSAAASIADMRARANEAEQKARDMEDIARQHEEMVHRVRAWYDAPRYHLVDRVRDVLRRIPGFRQAVRFAWNLISTRPESPELEVALEQPKAEERQPEQPGEGQHEVLEEKA
jgi:hypothetical protein